MSVQLSDLWTVAGIILGFQLAAFSWRISRELEMRAKRDITWLPPADILNLVSMAVVVIGVFALPILGLADLTLTQRLFGLGLLLFLGYPFALVGHYRLFKPGHTEATYFSLQEKLVLAIILLISIVYLISAFADQARSWL
ncbi:MAG TPA: hypothetical protein VH349_06510 [Ktedonobacterales bacterium]